MNTISAQAPIIPVPQPPKPPGVAVESDRNPFIDMLAGGIKEVNTLQTDADVSVHDLLTGKNVDSAEVLTSVQKADMAFRLMQQIRNKLVDAYREINQMQI